MNGRIQSGFPAGGGLEVPDIAVEADFPRLTLRSVPVERNELTPT